ncbi:MAG: PAS domain S-box protein [Thermomicrobiales bacterium]
MLDYRLGKRDGVSFAEHLAAVDHPAPIIMLTGQASLDIDLEAMRVGVSDFLPKDELTSGHLDRSIRYALRQRQGVQAVRASREFLRQALDALPQSIAILDEVGRIVAVNRQWRQFADLEGFNAPDYGVGMNYLSVCENTTGPDSLDAARVSDAIRRTISGEDPGFVLEYPCHSDEEQRWFEVTVSSFLADGSQRVIVAHENITRRIVAEREHFAVARTMETLMTSSPAAIVGVDREARITLWSPASERLFGWSKEEVIGKLNPLFSDGEREKMLDYHQRVLDGEIVIGREGYRLKKDGDFVPVHVSVARIESFDGEPIGALGIFLDLTSRLEVEQELKRREQQYRTLVETLPDSIVRYDRDLRRVFGNPAANSTVSVPVVDGKPPHLSELGLSCEQLQGWVARIQEALETGSPSDHEWFTTLGGTGRYFDTRVIPEPGMDGKPESVLVVSRDITERRQRESERQLLAKASAQLAATLDFDETLSTIMELMVPEFADVCSISLFDEGPVPIRRVALVKAGQDGLGVVHPDFQESEIEPVGDYGIPRVYQTGEPVVYERVDIEQVIQSTFPVELRSAARNLDQRSAMFVPLKVRARVIGAMGFAFGTSGRRYTEDDLPFAEDLANRAAIAIDNARLYKDLERSEERHRTLVEQIPAVVFTADADDLSRPRYLSPQIEQITGYSAGEFTDGRFNVV